MTLTASLWPLLPVAKKREKVNKFSALFASFHSFPRSPMEMPSETPTVRLCLIELLPRRIVGAV